MAYNVNAVSLPGKISNYCAGLHVAGANY